MPLNLLDDIEQRCRLPKPTGKPPTFVKIEKKPEPTRQYARIRHKNPGLYEPESPENYRREMNEILPEIDFASVKAGILQNGGEASQDGQFEAWLKQRQEMAQAEQSAQSLPAPRNPALTKNVFKKNALMRGLVNKMNNTEEFDREFLGKKNNKQLINNEPVLLPSREDPEIFLLKDTTNDTDKIDNFFRFAHHGTKKTVTPRYHSIHYVEDSDFEFKRP